eukprot:Colp12_sorted_trinity150504_noHs@33280
MSESAHMTDGALRKALKEFGQDVGPITGGTRWVYQRKLERLRSQAANGAAPLTGMEDVKGRQMKLVDHKVDKAKLKPGQKATDIAIGDILVDIDNNQWILDERLGKGGHGVVYGVKPHMSSTKPQDKDYVVKIESTRTSNTMDMELAFYQQVVTEQHVRPWMEARGLAHIGLPKYHSFGRFKKSGCLYQFVVIERLGATVGELFVRCDEKFSWSTVCKIAVQVVDVLEYIHSRDYVYGDIKGSNILLGKPGTPCENLLHIVDFGLADKYVRNQQHVAFSRTAGKFDGTVEYA